MKVLKEGNRDVYPGCAVPDALNSVFGPEARMETCVEYFVSRKNFIFISTSFTLC